MKPQNDPWADIVQDTPDGELRARRADSSHPHGFFWARDAKGHRLLVFQSETATLERRFPLLKGIAIEPSKDRLLLRLLENNDVEIFTTLCWSLIERTRQITSKNQVVDVIVSHLERWQRFLGRADSGLLSDQEVRGLLGELTFLENELLTRFGSEAVNFWHGPSGHPQDFAICTTLFEVKSRLAGAAPVLTISSAEQLWHESGDLYLVAYTIGQANEHAVSAVSLASVVARIRLTLAGSPLVDHFEDRLMQIRYFDHPEYDRKYYLISPPDFYEVRDGFPRITADAVPQGVRKVNYGVEIAACLPFTAIPNWLALGGNNGA